MFLLELSLVNSHQLPCKSCSRVWPGHESWENSHRNSRFSTLINTHSTLVLVWREYNSLSIAGSSYLLFSAAKIWFHFISVTHASISSSAITTSPVTTPQSISSNSTTSIPSASSTPGPRGPTSNVSTAPPTGGAPSGGPTAPAQNVSNPFTIPWHLIYQFTNPPTTTTPPPTTSKTHSLYTRWSENTEKNWQ